MVSQPAWVDLPNTARNQRITERATQKAPLITVWPNGGGRSWYSDWVNPGALGPQSWETFHLDQVIPLIDANLTVAGIPYDLLDYGDGSTWAPGCTDKHSQEPCRQADMDHFVQMIMRRLPTHTGTP